MTEEKDKKGVLPKPPRPKDIIIERSLPSTEQEPLKPSTTNTN